MTDNIKGVWDKTIFPEKIKNRKEERKRKRQIIHEAKMEAIEESKEQIKSKEKQKMTKISIIL